MVTVRYVVDLDAQHGLSLFQMDVYNAFLQIYFFEEVFMVLPPAFGSLGENYKVCRLLKSLYGLKQARVQWNLRLTAILTRSGFTQSKLDYSLFTKTNSNGDVVIFWYMWMIF